MKEESVIAFLTKNKRNFKVSDYSIIRKELNTINDNQFSLLMNTSFAQGWWIALSVILLTAGSLGFIYGAACWGCSYPEAGIPIMLVGTLSFLCGIYVLLDIRKRYALKQFLALVKSLTIN